MRSLGYAIRRTKTREEANALFLSLEQTLPGIRRQIERESAQHQGASVFRPKTPAIFGLLELEDMLLKGVEAAAVS